MNYLYYIVIILEKKDICIYYLYITTIIYTYDEITIHRNIVRKWKFVYILFVYTHISQLLYTYDEITIHRIYI